MARDQWRAATGGAPSSPGCEFRSSKGEASCDADHSAPPNNMIGYVWEVAVSNDDGGAA
jgi:hypothetical protein